MQCPECETDADAGARFCRRCGTPLPEEHHGPDEHTDAGVHGTTRQAAASGGQQPGGATSADLETSVIATPADDGPARRCPSCGAPNSPRRELCGRCGVDLESGVTPPRADGDDVTPSRRPAAAHHEHHHWAPWLLALAAVGVVVLVVGGLTLAGLGPLAGGPSLPEAEFARDVYGDEDGPLVISDIAASSTLEPSGGESYDPTQMADDDPATAWNSDGAQNEHGVGETIDLFLAEPVWIQRIVVNNGFQRDADSYADNARIRRAEVLLDGGERLSVRLEDLGLQRQAVELPEPLLTTTVRIEVTETFAGDTYPDLAVSDIGLEGWPARGEDVEIARERAEAARGAPPTR